jgi:nicotinamidase-related amidase
LGSDLRFGPLSPNTVHLCVDMQTLFAERTDWHVPWLERVLPAVTRLTEAGRERTVFTRFVPPERPEDAVGAWRRYYAHWRDMTGERLDPRLIQLVPPCQTLLPLQSSLTKPIIRRSTNQGSTRRSRGFRLTPW